MSKCHCWYFNIYEHDEFHAQFSWGQFLSDKNKTDELKNENEAICI